MAMLGHAVTAVCNMYVLQRCLSVARCVASTMLDAPASMIAVVSHVLNVRLPLLHFHIFKEKVN